jgi:hypothetical protein
MQKVETLPSASANNIIEKHLFNHCNQVSQLITANKINFMKTSVSKTIKLSCVAFLFTLFLASCQKENSDVVKEEVVGNISSRMTVRIGTRTVEYDAYATYCAGATNGKVFFNVSNNQVLLDTTIVSSDFRVNDFLIYYGKVGTNVSSIGGASFTENIGGTNVTSVVFDPAATITIDEANSQYVKGSMTGVFQLQSGGQAPYSVQFTAKVIRVSPFCN